MHSRSTLSLSILNLSKDVPPHPPSPTRLHHSAHDRIPLDATTREPTTLKCKSPLLLNSK
ncbi:hypothetical protein Hanom_Chr00s004516g01723071 [Helianthus anomalus]